MLKDSVSHDESSANENVNTEEFIIDDDEGYNASDLYNFVLPEQVWSVRRVLPEGLNILTGDEKRGKSFLALDLAICVSGGKPWLAKFPTQQGTVLYFALEDNPGRMKERLYGNPQEPEKDYLHTTPEEVKNIQIFHELPTLQGGALDALKDLYEKHRPILIVIDTLVLITNNSNGNAYKDEYQQLKQLEKFGLKNHVCILANHHTNKSRGHHSVFDRVNGSKAMVGATEVNLLLDRGDKSPQGILHIQSRVAECESWLLDMRKVKAAYVGNAEEEELSQARKEIKEALREYGPMTARELSSELDTNYNTTRNTMNKMVKDKQLIKIDGRKFSLPFIE